MGATNLPTEPLNHCPGRAFRYPFKFYGKCSESKLSAPTLSQSGVVDSFLFIIVFLKNQHKNDNFTGVLNILPPTIVIYHSSDVVCYKVMTCAITIDDCGALLRCSTTTTAVPFEMLNLAKKFYLKIDSYVLESIWKGKMWK